jgi:glycosyltransferase involved in cell wall biosynthesis
VGLSDNESFYMVMAEAMASKNATIITDYPTITGVAGCNKQVMISQEREEYSKPLIVDPYNTAQVAEAMYTLATDPDRREAIGARNRIIARDYTVQHSTDTLIAQLRQRGMLQ